MIEAVLKKTRSPFPYVIGRDLIEHGGPTRRIINFAQRDFLMTMQYEVPFARVKEEVMPVALEMAEREKKAKGEEVTRYTRIAQRWWPFYDYRPGTIAAISSVPRYIACSRTTKRSIFEFVSNAIHATASTPCLQQICNTSSNTTFPEGTPPPKLAEPHNLCDDYMNSLIHVDLKGVSKPVTKLIESVSKGIGKLYEPTAIRRKAKAKADATLILAQGETERRELLLRAAYRMAFVETRRQQVIESIVGQARRQLPVAVSEEPVSEDWMVQFFECAKDVGDQKMQALWAKILAGEVTAPGKYSRRTLEVLKTLDQQDALAFTHCCSVSFRHSNGSHFTFQTQSTQDCLGQLSEYEIENHLISLGLLAAEATWYGRSKLSGWVIHYLDRSWKISAPAKPMLCSPEIETPEKMMLVRFFTAIGEELATVALPSMVPGFVEKQAEELKGLEVYLEEVVEKS